MTNSRSVFLILQFGLIALVLNNIFSIFGNLRNVLHLLLMINILLFIEIMNEKNWDYREFFLLANFMIVSYYAFSGLFFEIEKYMLNSVLAAILFNFLFSLFKKKKRKKKKKNNFKSVIEELNAIDDKKPIDIKIKQKEGKKEINIKEKMDNGFFVANSKSKIYHIEGCRYVDPIPMEKRVVFNKKSFAKKKGYKSCKLCKP
ncbi:hypothetical protein HN827_09750 [archaeon]|jgi:hypothetical protein|nr:hypothetical protein [archaeon]MBT6821810.1 hypothetical protein [archaeon]MBT7393084.1 hypothetical protein [archaeon]